MEFRIAVKVVMKDTGEEVLIRYIKPSRLISELKVIQDNKRWNIAETYVANSYGIRMEE